MPDDIERDTEDAEAIRRIEAKILHVLRRAGPGMGELLAALNDERASLVNGTTMRYRTGKIVGRD